MALWPISMRCVQCNAMQCNEWAHISAGTIFGEWWIWEFARKSQTDGTKWMEQKMAQSKFDIDRNGMGNQRLMIFNWISCSVHSVSSRARFIGIWSTLSLNVWHCSVRFVCLAANLLKWLICQIPNWCSSTSPGNREISNFCTKIAASWNARYMHAQAHCTLHINIQYANIISTIKASKTTASVQRL